MPQLHTCACDPLTLPLLLFSQARGVEDMDVDYDYVDEARGRPIFSLGTGRMIPRRCLSRLHVGVGVRGCRVGL